MFSLSPADVDRHDIAHVNLLCAHGLPGAEHLDVAKCLATLDGWAQMVARYVRDTRPSYQRNPDAYGRHYGFFRFLSMVTLLKHPRGLGIGYQPTAIGNYDFSDSRDDFLHGLLTRRLGTCASLPVLYVAIGRRLGWPIYLAVAKRHIFCQWLNDDGSYLNLEGSCPGGGETYPDEHYHHWPGARLTRDDLATGDYLRPLTGAESLCLFLDTRGHCLADHRRFAEARDAHAAARRFAPDWSRYDLHTYALALRESQNRGTSILETAPMPPPFPTVNPTVPTRGLFPTIVSIPT